MAQFLEFGKNFTQRIVDNTRRVVYGRRKLWLERVLAAIALFNLILVLFDLSYLQFRNFYLREFPLLVRGFDYLDSSKFVQRNTPWILPVVEQTRAMIPAPLKDFPLVPEILSRGYDYVKGIRPSPETDEYLNVAEMIRGQVTDTGIDSPETREILQELRARSTDIIRTNPFEVADKTGTLETIKDRMRERVAGSTEGATDLSAEQAFNEFWSVDYLTSNDFREELAFYTNEIAPLIGTNYLRDIEPGSGEFIDRFSLLDIPFVIFFAIEFAIRTFFIHRTHTGLRWIEGMLWRWYDIFLFILVFRWLRVIPVVIRCNQSGLVDLRAVKQQASQGFVASIAEDITQVVVVRTINQVQSGLKDGGFARMVTAPQDRTYIDLNDINETAELAKLFSQLAVHQILPKIRPEVEALLRYNVEKAIHQSPAYAGLRAFPGYNRFEDQLSENLIHQLYQVVYSLAVAAIEEDPKAEKLIEELGTSATEAITSEMQSEATLERIQYLLDALLEEVKVNYVERLTDEDVEDVLEQTRKLRQVASKAKSGNSRS